MSMAGCQEVPHFLLYNILHWERMEKENASCEWFPDIWDPRHWAYIVNKQENNTRSADNWDVAARAVFFCYCWDGAGFQLGCGPSCPGLYFMFTMWPAQLFFLCENEPSLFFLKNTQSRPTYFSTPWWAANLSRCLQILKVIWNGL